MIPKSGHHFSEKIMLKGSPGVPSHSSQAIASVRGVLDHTRPGILRTPGH
jgi:hypothetical protein